DFDDHLLVSTDGAATWKEIFTPKGSMLGFSLSPDGSKIAVGGPKDGVNVASTTDYAFAKVSSFGAKCMKWTAAGLYACGDETNDGMTLGLSMDAGKTFTPLYHLPNVRVLACDKGSPFETTCLKDWPAVGQQIGADVDAGPL